jgi:hypothetical protein
MRVPKSEQFWKEETSRKGAKFPDAGHLASFAPLRDFRLSGSPVSRVHCADVTLTKNNSPAAIEQPGCFRNSI